MGRLLYLLAMLVLSLFSFLVSLLWGYSFSSKVVPEKSIHPVEEKVYITNLDDKVISEESIPTFSTDEKEDAQKKVTYNTPNRKAYYIFDEDQEIAFYSTFEEALKVAKSSDAYSVVHNNINIWSQNNKYQVYEDNKRTYIFKNYFEAVAFAKGKDDVEIYNKDTYTRVYHSNYIRPNNFKIKNTPLISNKPEFYLGTELASINMLLSSLNITTTKNALYNEIEKDFTSYSETENSVVFGDPNKGIVGNITKEDAIGYGAFNTPLYNLLKLYTPNAIDLTNVGFEEVENFISKGIPVAVITNDSFTKVPPTDFYSWTTPEGTKIHTPQNYNCVVIVGYDNENIYIHDSKDTTQKTIPKTSFIESWEQMGSMAVSYIK